MSTIAVNFQAQGVSRVMEAFASIEKRAVQFQTKAIRAQQLLTSAVQREAGKQEKAIATSADREARAFEKESARMRKLAEKSASARTKAADAASKAAEQAFQRETKAFERESERMGRIARRAADKRIREADRVAKEAARAAKEEAQARKQFGGAVSGKIMGAAGGVMRTAGAIAGGALALGGGFTALDSVQTMISNRGKAADIAIASGGELNKRDVLSRASSTATAYGTSTENALAATDRIYAKAGNAGLALDLMPKVMALATATGGDAGEIGEVGGQIYNADKTLSADQVDAVMRGWAGQGRAGSVDMRELAQYGSRIAAGAAIFGGDKAANMVKLGGLTQIATAGGASSAAEATESIAHLGVDVYKNKADFAARGINAFDKNGKVVDPEQLIRESVLKTKGNRGELQKLFGLQSIKAVAGAGNIFSDAYIKAKDGGASEKDAMAAGTKAMNDAFDTFKKAALTDEQVKADAAARLQETDKKIEAAMNDLKDKVATELLPAIEKFIPKLTEAIPKIADFAAEVAKVAEWFAENPFKGIVAMITLALAKDFAAAKIGNLIAGMAGSIKGGTRWGSGASGPPVLGSMTNGGMSKMATAGAALGILGAAVGVGAAGISAIDATEAANEAARSSLQRRDLSAANTAAEAMAGTKGDPKNKKEAEARRDALVKAKAEMARALASEKESMGDQGAFEKTFGFVTNLFGSDAQKTREAAQAASIKQNEERLKQLSDALEKAARAVDGFATVASNADQKNPKNRSPMSSPDRH